MRGYRTEELRLGQSEPDSGISLLHARNKYAVDDQSNLALAEVSRGDFAPGTVLCLDELTVRRYLDELATGLLAGCLRFNDTADTQTVVINLNNAPDDFILATDTEALNA